MDEPGALVSEWMDKEGIAPYLERGDLVEFKRTAKVGGRDRSFYAHWAIYIGKLEGAHRLVHISADDGDIINGEGVAKVADSFSKVAKGSRAQVRCDTLEAVAGNDNVRVNNSMDKNVRPFPPSIIVERATHSMGAGDYNIVFNNCEHFAKWARYGKKCSSQAVTASSLVVTTVATCVTTNPLLALCAGIIYNLAAPKIADLWNKAVFAFTTK